MIPKLNTSLLVSICIGILIVTALVTRGSGSLTENNNLFLIASFLFSIFIAFTIATSHSKLSRINEATNSEEGILLSIYRSSKVFGDGVQKKIQAHIDDYLIDQIDYYLTDFEYSSKSFTSLFDYLIGIKPENEQQALVYQVIVGSLNESAQNRKTVESLVHERVLTFEWVSILTLLGVILYFIFDLNNGSLTMMIASIALSTAAIILVFVLKDLDNLKWKEKSWIWEPLENLFTELDLVPYFPKDVIDEGRATIEKGQKIRVATYPNKYPDMSGKEVQEVEV